MATHSSILACKIPWTQKPGGLQSVGSQRVTRLSTHAGTCHVLRVFLKSGSSSTLARLIPQQSSKDDYPYFKSETCEAQSLSNLRGDVQLVGCIVRIWNQVCVTQWSAAFYHSLMHPQRWEWGWISLPECPGHCCLLSMESHWLRQNQWSRSQAINENVGFSAAATLFGGKVLPSTSLHLEDVDLQIDGFVAHCQADIFSKHFWEKKKWNPLMAHKWELIQP